MTATISDPADVLERAAAEIERRGLAKGEYYSGPSEDDPACMCAIGAISFAAYGDPEMYETHRDELLPVLAPLAQVIDGGADIDWLPAWAHEVITRFNDASTISAADVADRMRAAARRLREDGTVEISIWDVQEGQQIIRGGRLVVVTERAHGVDVATGRELDDLHLTWQSSETDADGIPVVSGRTYVESGKDETVRLVSAPAVIDVPEVAL